MKVLGNYAENLRTLHIIPLCNKIDPNTKITCHLYNTGRIFEYEVSSLIPESIAVHKKNYYSSIFCCNPAVNPVTLRVLIHNQCCFYLLPCEIKLKTLLSSGDSHPSLLNTVHAEKNKEPSFIAYTVDWWQCTECPPVRWLYTPKRTARLKSCSTYFSCSFAFRMFTTYRRLYGMGLKREDVFKKG